LYTGLAPRYRGKIYKSPRRSGTLSTATKGTRNKDTMFAAAEPSPPVTPPVTATVIDENWAAKTIPAPTARPAVKPAAKVATVDPRIAAGVATVLAAAPPGDPAANRQHGLQSMVYGADARAVEKFAKGFSEAKKPACLSPATGGLGLFAIPVIAVQALRGKCSMP
jgi:hypothetical protein